MFRLNAATYQPATREVALNKPSVCWMITNTYRGRSARIPYLVEYKSTIGSVGKADR